VFFFVDDFQLLRQLANDIDSGCLRTEELRELNMDSTGRGQRRKFQKELTDSDSEVYSPLKLSSF